MSCASLLQLSLKGCPVTRLQGYRQALLTGLPQLKYLDYSFITEEERRRARLSWQRETRRRRRLTQLRRHGALLDAAITSSRLLWECPDPQVSLSTLKEKTFIMLPASQHGSSEDESSSASLSTCGALDDAYCQAAELKDVTVEIYGPGAIAKLLCQSLSQRSVASITVLKLHYVCFQEVFPDLVQLRKKFPGINCLYLRCCRVDELCHLKMLSRLQGLKSITVEDAGNRVTLLSVWKPYFIFCLGDDVETLNSSPITLVEKRKADLLFSGITKFTELGSELQSLDQCADTSSFQVKPEGNPESLPSQIVQDAFRRAEKQQMLRMSCHRVWTSILARAVAPALVRHQDLPKAMEASLRKALEKSHCST
uniref:Putative conserved proteinconserved protein n=1 Tax=Ixodes ricinus TaxID=34613 RepID=A0A147BMS3_IXORI